MFKKVLIGSLGALLLVGPLVVSADTLSDTMDQARFLLTREAASAVNFDASKPDCLVMVSTSTAQVHEKFFVAWGAWGLQDSALGTNTWRQNGASVIAVDAPGTYLYKLTFYGAGGAKTSCEATVSVK